MLHVIVFLIVYPASYTLNYFKNLIMLLKSVKQEIVSIIKMISYYQFTRNKFKSRNIAKNVNYYVIILTSNKIRYRHQNKDRKMHNDKKQFI